ncbi:carbohydrate ABC transporter permease [Halobellus ordinarius]|uniref:carbohydrate ABC transporter permease n=1 Tax=Halobellus ordinarius TaxID=3075120 RepID=UPI0028801BBC|nr:carbohydrate ABC transporter permease [Halobellus sp. ZY16]
MSPVDIPDLETVAKNAHLYKRRIRRQWKLHGTLLLSIVVLLLPVVLVALMSTQTKGEILNFTFLGIGSDGLSNYSAVLQEHGFANYLKNSFVMATLISVGKVGISLLAALAIVFFDFRFKRATFIFILLTLTLPVPIRIVPLFEMMVDLNWNDTMLALVMPYFASATSVLLLRQHFESISESIVETAKLDGIGPIKFLVYVLIPMSKSMLIGLYVIAFIWSWNQYLWPLVAIQSESNQVVQVGLKQLQGAQAAGETLWGLIMAGTILALLPPLVILILANKPLLETFNVQTK